LSRSLRLSKHGNSVCVPITKEAKELDWKPDMKVQVSVKHDHLIIERVEEVV
jgi:antitoxin component of MazEF toxin-antitoxin module